ncbi:MAG: hypothetical protein ACE5IZ_07625 [Dehalococcoidia bacterium]
MERAVAHVRQSFFYGRIFRDLEDLNAQCAAWLQAVANARVHGTTREVPAVRLEQEHPHLLPLPQAPYIPMLTLGRRVKGAPFYLRACLGGGQAAWKRGVWRRVFAQRG